MSGAFHAAFGAGFDTFTATGGEAATLVERGELRTWADVEEAVSAALERDGYVRSPWDVGDELPSPIDLALMHVRGREARLYSVLAPLGADYLPLGAGLARATVQVRVVVYQAREHALAVEDQRDALATELERLEALLRTASDVPTWYRADGDGISIEADDLNDTVIGALVGTVMYDTPLLAAT